MSKKNKNKNKPWQQAGGYPGSTGGFGGLPGHSAQTILSSAGGSPLSKGGTPTSDHHSGVGASGQLGADSPSGAVGPTDGLEAMSDQRLVDEARAETEAPVPATTDSPDPLTAGGSPEASPASVAPPVSTQVSRAELVEALRGVRHTRDALNRLKDQADAARIAHERAKAEVATRLEELERRELALSARETDVSKRDSEMEARRLELLALQAAASEGFPEQLRDARNALEAAHQRRVAEVDAQRALLQQEGEVLDKDRAALGKERVDIERAKREITYRLEHIKDMELLAEEQATARVNDRIETLERSIERAVESQKRVGDQLQRSQLRVKELEAILGTAGGASLVDLTSERDHLRKEVDRLQMELNARPGQATVELYKKAQERVDVLDVENQRLGAALSQARSELERMRMPVGEMETQRVALRSLELRNAALKEANDQLQIEVEGRLNQASGRNPYPELERMDAADSEYQNPPARFHQPTNLKQVVDDVRNRMAADEALFYDDRTIRCFLAGLAMSRLHLLQGISGTGKTSLPRAFAKALGGHADIVAVQAGWRDRQDLLGYYNAFDKKYHESSFVKALYAAQCPTWSDRLFIVVLDEMNLSYIEQFGADLLSELESPKKPNLPQLGLMDSRPPRRPTRLLEEGTAIAVPPNVWFVGTANHDETTKDFADKTYDRAHTMELPRHPTSFKPVAASVPPPASCSALRGLFDTACQRHVREAAEANAFVTALEPDLKGKFNIGWGNRLERQITRYAPVIVAAGGTVGEAIDHVVATKLLRKLRNRHDVRVKELQELRTALRSRWKDRKLDPAPTQCEELLTSLIRTRSFEEGEAAS